MQYLCLIYESEDLMASKSEADRNAEFGEYMGFTKDLQEAGKFVAGDALQSVNTATTVRIRDGEVLHTDGPFAETREQLGGYYLIEASDLDEALEWAKKIPAARTGCIEVRPIMVFDM